MFGLSLGEKPLVRRPNAPYDTLLDFAMQQASAFVLRHGSVYHARQGRADDASATNP
jgi:hypothetical protein